MGYVFIYFSCDNQGDNVGNITAKIRIPYREVIPAANTQSFINIKSLEVSLKLLDKKDFFMFNKVSNKYKIYKNDGSEGIGVLQFDTGDIYQGEFHNNFMEGVGKYIFEDGEYHEGFYAN